MENQRQKVKYWNASYDTKADAQAALMAYWANKHEARKARLSIRNEHNERRSFNEGFLSDVGKKWIRDIQHYLITIFGHTLYFDRTTDKETGLFYKGQCVAEFMYNDPREEVIIYRSIFTHHCYQWLLLNHTKQGVEGSLSARNTCLNRMFLAPFMSLSCTQPQCLHTTDSLWLSGILEYNNHATQSQQHLLKNLTKVRELGTSHLPCFRLSSQNQTV